MRSYKIIYFFSFNILFLYIKDVKKNKKNSDVVIENDKRLKSLFCKKCFLNLGN